MSDKYIIKNCPAYSKDALDFCLAKNATQAICYNCTDCLLKQIYNLCNKYKEYDIIALQVTRLLDIEECESENTQS